MRRFYVTLTWDDWPEGGSFGTIVSVPDDEANPYAYAEAEAKNEMAHSRADDEDGPDYYLEHYGDEWEVVDKLRLRRTHCAALRREVSRRRTRTSRSKKGNQ